MIFKTQNAKGRYLPTLYLNIVNKTFLDIDKVAKTGVAQGQFEIPVARTTLLSHAITMIFILEISVGSSVTSVHGPPSIFTKNYKCTV